MNLTKKDICRRIADKLNLRQQDVHDVVDTFLDHVERAFWVGTDVELRGFGSFRVVRRKGRVGRNPKIPGRVVPVPERFAVKFKCGKELRTKMRAMPINRGVSNAAV